MLVCGLPAFAAGLIEDLIKKVSPGKHLLAAMVSAALAFYILDGIITRTDIICLNWIVGTSLRA